MNVKRVTVLIVLMIVVLSTGVFGTCYLKIYASIGGNSKRLKSCDVSCYGTETCKHQITKDDCFNGNGDYEVKSKFYNGYSEVSHSDWIYGYTCNGNCVYGSWTNDKCGGDSCQAGQMHQTRTLINGDSNTCTATSRCVSDSSCIVITITSPKSNEIINPNTQYTIKWTHTGNNPDFHHYSIYYMCQGEDSNLIGYKNNINDDHIIWDVSSYENEKECTIYVYAMDKDSNLLASDQVTFSIVKPSVQITKPSDNEIINPNTQYTIRWKSQNMKAGKIRILFYNGNSWQTVAYNLPLTTTSYYWNVPDIESSNCKLRLGSYNPSNGKWIAYDQVTFSITNCGNGHIDNGEMCDPPGSSCYYTSGDYCYYNGTCSNNCGSCSGAKNEYCPSPGTVKNGYCYYGNADEYRCNKDGCRLSKCKLGDDEICNALEGCKHKNNPNPPKDEDILYVDLMLTDNFASIGDELYGVVFVKEYDNGNLKKIKSDDNVDVQATVDGNKLPDPEMEEDTSPIHKITFEKLCEKLYKSKCDDNKHVRGWMKGWKCMDNYNQWKNNVLPLCEAYYQNKAKNLGINLDDYEVYWMFPINTEKYHSTVTTTATTNGLTGYATTEYLLTNGLETVVYIPAPYKYEVPLAELNGQYYGNFSRGQTVDFIGFGKVYKNGIPHTCSDCTADYYVHEGEYTSGDVVESGSMSYNPLELGYDGNVSTKGLDCDKWYTLEVNMTDPDDNYNDSSVSYFYVDCTPRILIKKGGRIMTEFGWALNETNINMFTVEVYNPNSTRQDFSLQLSSTNTPNPINLFGISFENGDTTISIPTDGFSYNSTNVSMKTASRAGVYSLKVSLLDDGEEVNNRQVKISIFAESLTEFLTKFVAVVVVGAGILFFATR